MTAWAGLALALGAMSLLLGCVLTHFERVQASAWRAGAENKPASVSSTAQERSLALLKDVLSEQEFEQWTRQGYLDVSSPNEAQRIYRIRRADGLVRVYEQGKAVRALCLQPVEPLPSNDLVVLHKLMIQGNEQEYVQKANLYPALFPDLYRP